MELKTPLKNEMTPPLSFGGGPSSLGSRSLMNAQLMATVVLREILAITQRTLNCVFPKNPMYFGRLIYPKTYPMILPMPTTRLAIAFADSEWNGKHAADTINKF